ncbi:O-methyltransferase [Kitasatospora herbaricolor]|uniref:class I SAM-dependent methyltransferase n=1 Tax=Kitasatospora herbaricolor TaxID=68217 RepID=UPI00174B3721|nr:class I SAM-dependent methyltransferase [Kitasatospora herbaricolor]MDQ0306513.1 O-methyltransferase involved in polyketide biosynthesis [Kitasatospora herbaricolor]GGV34494.1 O-methyltransferase [Kitasatospora herbaricolor]
MTARRPASSDRVPSDRVPADAAPTGATPATPAPAGRAAASAPVVADDLAAVPETALWTLYHRAVEAARPDTVLPDPKAVELVERIDYPFDDRFAGGGGLQAQLQALRVACFDREVADFLTRHPRGTVVCLGEGLETQYWRVDNGRARWLSVDLPELIALRERLLPTGPRQRLLACSVTDPRWMDEVDPAQGVLITAQGLLMYLRPGEVRELIAGCAERFPGGTLVLDAVPRWFSRLTLSGRMRTRSYQAPPMPWGMDADERSKLRTASAAVVAVRDVWPVGGRGLLGALLPLALRVPPLATRRPSVAALEFAGRPEQS